MTPKTPRRDGRLIALCGIDGSGKTTQVRRLSRWLTERDIPVVETRQPSDMYRENPHVRAYLDHGHNALGMVGLSLLAAADRQLHIRNVINPAIAAGTWVICDRYVYSSYAFFAARGVDVDFVRRINVDIPLPDVTFFVDVPVETALERIRNRDGAIMKFEERSVDFMVTVRSTFLACADATFVTIDGLQPPDDIATLISSHIENTWPAEFAEVSGSLPPQ